MIVLVCLVAAAHDLLPREAYELHSSGGVPRMSADESTIVTAEFAAESHFEARPIANLDATPAVETYPLPFTWWDVEPDGKSVVLITTSGLVVRLTFGGEAELLGNGVISPRWVEPRWADHCLIAAARASLSYLRERAEWAMPTAHGLDVVRIPLDGGDVVTLFHDGTADDVVLDSALKPRLLLDRTKRHHGRGLDYQEVQPRSVDGKKIGEPFWQVGWIADNDAVPHVGDGAIQILGGGDRASLGSIGPSGFEAGEMYWGDVTRLLTDPSGQRVDAAGEYAERRHWHASRPAVGAELAWLERALSADVIVTQRSSSDRYWIVQSRSGSQLDRYYLFDRETREWRRVGLDWGEADTVAWQPVEPRVLHARDGLPIAAYLTRPDPRAYGPPPYALVVQVHGGPWAGSHAWRLDAQAQQWADRGYATLAVNFRGTRGFGWKLINSSEFADDPMVHDVDDAITWAIDAGVADRTRIAMVGASYGGFATLTFASMPEPRLRCGVAGITYGNLTTPGGGLNIYSVKNAAWREEHSPDRHTENIRAQLLVWTGGTDGPNADQGTEPFVERALRNGKTVTWLRFPHEGHGLKTPANSLALETIQDRFLAQCLGGPSWPFDADAIRGADLEVRAGADAIPELAAAWGERASMP